MENLKKVIFEQALMYEQQENETNMLYIQPAEILRTIITQSDLDEEYAEYKRTGKLSNDCLEILDMIEEFRHKNETAASHDDYTIRLIEAIIAKYFGITNRAEWCDLLKQDKSSKYYAHCKAELPLIFTYGGTENE